MMEFTAEMIAGFLGGQVAGDKEAKVHTVSSIEEGEPGALTYLTNPKYEKHLYKTRASIVLVNKDFTPSEPVTATLIKVEDTGAAVLKLLQMYQAAKPRKQGISERASISERATLGEDCYVGDFAVIEAGARIGADCQIYPQVYIGDGVTVGDGTILYPGVKIYEGCVIGSRCILHAGAVIGADGFGFIPNAAGGFDKIPMGQNERNAKSGTLVESCSLLLLTSLHFTTDIFSAKSRVRICKYSANEQLSPAVRRCNFFCFYGIAGAAGLRRTNGNIGNTIGNIDR